MSEEIHIYPTTSETNHRKIDWLRTITPNGYKKAEQIIITADKYIKGGGWFMSKERRGRQLENQIYELEQALRKHRFREKKMYIEGPVPVLFDYLSLFSKAYPDCRKEYKLLNHFIPNCSKYQRIKDWYDKIKKHPSPEGFKAGVLRNKHGDYIYPGEEGYEELLAKKKDEI